MKKFSTFQKYLVLAKLEMARSGQRWPRLKICLAYLSAKIRSRKSSRHTSDGAEPRTHSIITTRSLMSISNVVPVC